MRWLVGVWPEGSLLSGGQRSLENDNFKGMGGRRLGGRSESCLTGLNRGSLGWSNGTLAGPYQTSGHRVCGVKCKDQNAKTRKDQRGRMRALHGVEVHVGGPLRGVCVREMSSRARDTWTGRTNGTDGRREPLSAEHLDGLVSGGCVK